MRLILFMLFAHCLFIGFMGHRHGHGFYDWIPMGFFLLTVTIYVVGGLAT